MAEVDKSTWTSFLKSIATFSGDLSSLTAPSFILSGTSLLEYSSYWGEHPQLFSDIANGRDAEARMLAVVRWYISTLKGQFSARHESAGGEKKPLNPVLGETFHGNWDGAKGETVLVAEQVSHHPPISAYRMRDPSGITLQGHNGQKSGFSGRTITVKQVGHATLVVPLSAQQEETYLITLPQLSLEGLFFGSPYAELMDKSYIVSTTGWIAEHEYSGRGWLSGVKNTIKTRIYAPGQIQKGEKSVYVVDGQWSEQDSMHYSKRSDESSSTPLIPVSAASSSSSSSSISPLSSSSPTTPSQSQPQKQASSSSPASSSVRSSSSGAVAMKVKELDFEYESRKVWAGVSKALKDQDYEAASRLKAEIEAQQRNLRKSEKEAGTVWRRRYFRWEDEPGPVIARLLSVVGQAGHGAWVFKDTKGEVK